MWAVSLGYRLHYKCEKVGFAHLFLKVGRDIMGQKGVENFGNEMQGFSV